MARGEIVRARFQRLSPGCLGMMAWLLAGALSAAGQVAPQEKKSRDLTELSVEELANVEVTTAGKKAQKRREVAPPL